MESIPDGLDVSRETFDDLVKFHDLLVKWNAKINLVSKASSGNLWDRHIWDSAQIVPISGNGLSWVDIGSGGGFPALVVAIMAKRALPGRKVTMVESDQRKSAFLRTVIRELSLNAEVIASRVETADPLNADVLSTIVTFRPGNALLAIMATTSAGNPPPLPISTQIKPLPAIGTI